MSEICTYVEFYFSGMLFPEVSRQEMDSDDYREVRQDMPGRSYAFAFNRIETITVEFSNGVRRKITQSLGRSPIYYPDGKVFSIAEIKEQKPDSVLYRNMCVNDWDAVVCTKQGNYQHLEEGDVVFGENYSFTYKRRK